MFHIEEVLKAKQLSHDVQGPTNHDFHHCFPGGRDKSRGPVPNPAAEMEPDFVGETLVERPKGRKGEQESRGVILGEGIYWAEVNSHETSREPFQMWLLMKGRWGAQ